MKKILALKMRRLGDTVLWTSSLQALIDLGFTVDILYPQTYKALFSEDPRFPLQLLSEKLTPNRTQYDAVLDFHASPSSQRLAQKFSAPIRLNHFHSRIPISGNSTLPIPHLGTPMKATERDLNVVRTLGWKGPAPLTKLFVGEKRRKPFLWLKEKKDKPWIFFGPESSRPSKEWPLEYYVELAQLIKDRYWIGFFAQNEAKVVSDPRYQALKKIACHLQTPTLDEVLGAMPFASIFVGSDSGLKHIAVALGVRTLTLFGPESIGEWHCYDSHLALQIPVACRTQDSEPIEFSWCNAERCPLASHACLRLIRPEDVVKVL